MKRLPHPARQAIAVLRDTRGVAMIELAFILPIILLLGTVGIEMANYAVTSMRISQAAMHIADNGSRVGDNSDLSSQEIFESDVNDLFAGVNIQAGETIELYEHGRVIISSLEVNDDGGQWVRWQRCMGKKNVSSSYGDENEGETGTDFEGMGKSGSELEADEGEAVIFVEVQYDYQPLIDNGFTQPFLPTAPIAATAAFHVRATRDSNGLQQTSPAAPVASCSQFTGG